MAIAIFSEQSTKYPRRDRKTSLSPSGQVIEDCGHRSRQKRAKKAKDAMREALSCIRRLAVKVVFLRTPKPAISTKTRPRTHVLERAMEHSECGV
eukprot:COSAG04_NODE_6604_length_1296_cov_1.384294_1_plen_95_part_00